jgi:hypothetical protein
MLGDPGKTLAEDSSLHIVASGHSKHLSALLHNMEALVFVSNFTWISSLLCFSTLIRAQSLDVMLSQIVYDGLNPEICHYIFRLFYK